MPGGQSGRRLRAVPASTDPDPLTLLPDDMLTCRAEVHDLQPLDGRTWVDWSPLLDSSGRVLGRSRVLECRRCGALARDVSMRHEYGTRKRQWNLPPGYSMPKGQARSKRESRVEEEARFYARLDSGTISSRGPSRAGGPAASRRSR